MCIFDVTGQVQDDYEVVIAGLGVTERKSNSAFLSFFPDLSFFQKQNWFDM